MEVRGGSMEVFIEVRGAPWSSVEVSMEVCGGSMEVSMEVHGGLHGGPWSRHGPPQSLLHGGLHGGLRSSGEVGATEAPWRLHGVPWRSPRRLIELHGAPWRSPWSAR